MKRKALMILSLIVLVCMMAATIHAQGVLKSSQKSPEQVVAARKFAMGAMGADAGDLKGKIKTGNIKGIAANAVSIAALATFLPLVYQETYPQVYPVKGSKYFFKEAPQANMETGFENLRIQAQKLMKLASANDKSGVEAQTGKLLGACGGCHKAYRGKY
ncbi:MAG: cytochrome c [Candidatus Desulfatibia sp.]|uniref:cytochrome c n=1 Tax=Candidatus Desulfatibia sp. TaxID=3101189 RepID=UPI002F2E354B